MSIKKKTFIRTALLGSTATLMAGASMGVSAVAVAQGEEVETIIVTGSRIARADLSSVSPLTVVGSEDFRLSGSVNVEQLLNTLPQTIPGFDSSSNNPGGGTATVNLRGLGAARTLVLVNGRRFMPTGVGGVVDLNNIPVSLIERVEVVTGGASAVYGSDAMAGVVNFILKDDFEGVQFDYQYTVSDRGDGDIHSVSGVFGGNFADGRGNATVFANYWLRKPVFADAREFSTVDLNDTNVPGTFRLGGSSGVPEGSIGVFGVALVGNIAGDPCNINGADSASIGCIFDTSGNLLPFNDPANRFNFAPDNFLQINGERWTFTAMADYDINQYLRFYTEMNFVNNRIDNILAPTPVFTTVSLDIDSPFFSPSTQTGLASLDTDGDGFVSAVLTRRNVEVGPRQALNDLNAFRVVIGLDGTLDNGWRYDAYYSFGRVARLQRQEANINVGILRQGLKTIPDPNNPGQVICAPGSDSRCIPFNPFGLGNITPEMAEILAIPVSNFTRNTEQIASISMSGDGFDLGAGASGFAIGGEYRREFGDFRPDFALSSGLASGFNQAQPLGGKFEVWELFAEAVVPLLADLPGMELLEISGAVRFSDYSTAGTVYTYAAGLNWDVIDGFRIRGAYQRAVRAPNIAELFAGQGQNFPGAQDPCAVANFAGLAATNPGLGAACAANGAVAGGFNQPNSQIPSTVGGNPNLGVETADSYTVGFVAQPNFIPGLNVTLDYYTIDISGAIVAAAGGAQGVLNACLITGDGTSSNPFCNLITRRGTGAVQDILLLQANLGFIKTSGLDLQVDYNFDLADLGLGDNAGSLTLFFLGTHVIETTIQAGPGLTVDDCAGNFGGFCGQPDPSWRSSARLTWNNGPVSISSRWRYIGATNDDRIELGGRDPATLSRARIDAKHYFDLSFTYQYDEHFTIFGGIDNVFSNKPPIIGSPDEQNNTFPRTFPTLGAKFFVGGTARF